MIECVIIVCEEDTAVRHCWSTAIAVQQQQRTVHYRLQPVTTVVRDISRVCLSVCACLVWDGFTFDPSLHRNTAAARKLSGCRRAAAPLENIGNGLRAEYRADGGTALTGSETGFIFNLSCWPVWFVDLSDKWGNRLIIPRLNAWAAMFWIIQISVDVIGTILMAIAKIDAVINLNVCLLDWLFSVIFSQ